MEMGYNFCASLEEGRQNMNSLHFRDLNPTVVARILVMMVRTHCGLDDLALWTSGATKRDSESSENQSPTSWNIEVFVQLLKEFVSTIFRAIYFIC